MEGVDGSGKTTLAQALKERIGNAVTTFEPTKGKLGAMLRSGDFGKIPPAAEALLFVADRAIHTEEIKNNLDNGYWVICDRYFASTIAYQSASLGDEADMEWLEDIQKCATIEPDAVFLLDIDPSVGLSRVDDRGIEKSRFEKLDFLMKVRSTYLSLAKRHGYDVIDASRSAEEVLSDVVSILVRRGLLASE